MKPTGFPGFIILLVTPKTKRFKSAIVDKEKGSTSLGRYRFPRSGQRPQQHHREKDKPIEVGQQLHVIRDDLREGRRQKIGFRAQTASHAARAEVQHALSSPIGQQWPQYPLSPGSGVPVAGLRH